MIAAVLALMIAQVAPAPFMPGPALKAASTSLAGRRECTAFTWLANDQGGARGAISVPVMLNGRALRMQLDTGANATILYGKIATQAGWATATAEQFRAQTLTVAGATTNRPEIFLNREMEADADVQGTLGLPALFGRVAVVDYPGQRFCLFAEPDLPAALATGGSVHAMLRNGKFYIPLKAGSFASDLMVFDTGSSEMALHVDLAAWKTLTGRSDTQGAPAALKGMAWGNPFVLAGAPSAEPMTIGKVTLGQPILFTNPATPNSFDEWPMPTAGVIGNAPFWDGMVVMDMTAAMRFRVIR